MPSFFGSSGRAASSISNVRRPPFRIRVSIAGDDKVAIVRNRCSSIPSHDTSRGRAASRVAWVAAVAS
jgi:hypothetical protein